MLNFDFYNPTKIIFGKNRLDELKDQIPKDAKILITYGSGSIKKFGTLDKIKKALNGGEYLEFGYGNTELWIYNGYQKSDDAFYNN